MEDEFCLWPENVTTFAWWLRVQTQWHRDFGQRYALNYEGVKAVLDFHIKRKKERAEIFANFQVMESAALEVWSTSK